MAQQNTDMLDGLQAAVIAEAQKKKENIQLLHLQYLFMEMIEWIN